MQRILGFLGLVLLVLTSGTSFAQQNSPNAADEKVRYQIADALKEGNQGAAQELLEKLQAGLKPQTSNAAAIPESGSVFFEEIKACGFYPQETRLECVVEIRQPLGYGGPIGSPGSMEHVYFCVDSNNDGVFEPWEPVGEGILQMHDESGGSKPPWEYAVFRDFDPFGGLRTTNTGAHAANDTNGPTRKVRAILSWMIAPTGCNFHPIWGNVVDFRIRFDPFR